MGKIFLSLVVVSMLSGCALFSKSSMDGGGVSSQTTGGSSDIRYECPIKFQTVQTLKDQAPEGWSFFRESQSRQFLDTVTVFDGPPEQHLKYSLSYDRNTF